MSEDTPHEHHPERAATSQSGTRWWSSFSLGRKTAWVMAIVPLLFGVALIAAVGQASWERTATDDLPAGADSTLAVELAEQLPEQDGSTAVIVFSADTGELTPAQTGQIAALLVTVTGEQQPPFIPSEDQTAALGIVEIDATSATEVSERVTDLREILDEDTPDGVTAQVTGPAGIEADLAAVFEGANFRLLGITALVVAILLIVTYRSPILWLVPLTVIGIADQAAAVLATHVLEGLSIPWNESTVGILSVLVFGAGTDYALLLISRYRDELRNYPDRRTAMGVAVRNTFESVMASGGTVIVGLLTLALSLIPTTRGLGVAGAVGIVTAMFFVLAVLPSALVLFPRGIFWPRTPKVGDPNISETRTVWRRIGGVVAARPVVSGTAVVIVLGILALGNLPIKVGLDSAQQFLSKPEAISASERIAESFPAGTANPTTIVTKADAAQVASSAADVTHVSSVAPVAEDGSITELQVVLDVDEGSSEAEQAITDLRAALDPYADTHVGGPEAQALDATDAAARDRNLIIPLVLGLVLVALIALLRSVVAPTLLVLTVVGTYFAALGASWWVFTGVLGFTALDEGVPLLAFLFLVSLGVDYNIFLITRAREEASTFGYREGMLRALGATGGVITSAGILLAAVFATLGVLPLVVLAQLGVVVCIGVLLDTLIVRTMLVPALAFVLKDAFWWPRRLQRSP